MDTFWSDKHSLKHSSSIKTTEFGIIMEDNDVHQ
jgi:hypothetical protein